MFDSERVATIIAIGREERWEYSKVFESLKSAGVIWYEMCLREYRLTYFGDGGSYTEVLPEREREVWIGGRFDPERIEAAFQSYQRREISYALFLERIAGHGVHRYRVNMAERTFDYLGKNIGERYRKDIPGVSEG